MHRSTFGFCKSGRMAWRTREKLNFGSVATVGATTVGATTVGFTIILFGLSGDSGPSPIASAFTSI